jgi:hypothetical protein
LPVATLKIGVHQILVSVSHLACKDFRAGFFDVGIPLNACPKFIGFADLTEPRHCSSGLGLNQSTILAPCIRDHVCLCTRSPFHPNVWAFHFVNQVDNFPLNFR